MAFKVIDQTPITILKDTITCAYNDKQYNSYVPVKGQICQILEVPAIAFGIENTNVSFYVGHKIGDGQTSLAELPFEEKDFKNQIDTYLKSTSIILNCN